MPIGFYSSYPTLDRAYEASKSNIRARRAGVFRIYRRLDGRYETHFVLGEVVPPHAELEAVFEFQPLEQFWLRIV
jgi:hypothetical protein